MEEVVYASRLAFKVIEEPFLVWDVVERLAQLGGVFGFFSLLRSAVFRFACQTTGDISATCDGRQAVVDKANELFEAESGVAQELATASASGIAIGIFWYAILATSALFALKVEGELGIVAWIGVAGYVLAILRGVAILAKCRKKLWVCLLMAMGVAVGIGASAVITVLTCAYADMPAEGDPVRGCVVAMCVVTACVPLLVKICVDHRQQRKCFQAFADMGLGVLDANNLSMSIVGMRPPRSKKRLSFLVKLRVVIASVVFASVGFGWVLMAEPLYDSEAVYVVGEMLDDGEYVERSFNLLGKAKKEFHLSASGEETVYFQTIDKLGNTVSYVEYRDGEFKGLASMDFRDAPAMIEGLRGVTLAHGEECWVHRLSDDGRGVVEASLWLDNEDSGNSLYEYVTYDGLGRSATLATVNETGHPVDEILEYEFEGTSDIVAAIDYRNADTGELSQRAQYERGEDGKTEKIHWYLPNGEKFAIAYYDENEKFLGWDDSF